MIKNIKNRVVVLCADPHIREMAVGTLLAFTLKIVGLGLAFAFSISVARLLGAEGAGLYFLALSVAVIGSVVGRVGLDNALLRFVALHATNGEWGSVRGVHALGMRIAIIASGILSLLCFLLAPWVAEALFDKPILAEPLRWMSLSILPYAILNLQAESLKGLKRIRDAVLIQGLGVPFFGLLLIWPLSFVAGVNGVVWSYLVATILVAVISYSPWRQAIKHKQGAVEAFPVKVLWNSCNSLYITSIIGHAVLPWGPLFLLGIWASSEDVGVFGAATRISMLVGVFLGAVNTVISPKFAELYSLGDMQALAQTSKRMALLTTLFASPFFLVLILGGDWVMLFFGEEFRKGGAILAVLAVGQLINTFCGSVGQLLIMSGNEADVRNGMIGLALGTILVCLLLIPDFGMMGGAIGIFIPLAVWNLWMTLVVKWRLGFVPIPINTNVNVLAFITSYVRSKKSLSYLKRKAKIVLWRIEERLNNKTTIYIFGDSHAAYFNFKSSKSVHVRVIQIPGATAYGLAKEKTRTGAGNVVRSVLKGLRGDVVVILQFGEVDCAFSVWKRAYAKNSAPAEEVVEACNRYMSFIGEIKSMGFERLFVATVPPPTVSDWCEWEGQLIARREIDASLGERTACTVLFNSLLRKQALTGLFCFLDVEKKYLDEQTGLVREELKIKNNLHLDWGRAREINMQELIRVGIVPKSEGE